MGSLLKNTEIIRQHMPRDRSHSKNTNNHKKIGVPSDYPATQPQDDQRLSIVKKIIDEMETRNEDKQYAVELLRMKQAAKRADLEQQQQQQQQQSAGQNGSRLAEQESSKNQQEQQQLVDVYRQVRPPSSISAVQPPLKQKIGKPLPPPNFKLEKRPESASNQTPAILTRAPFTAEPPMAVFSDYDCDVQYRQTIVLTNISSRVNTFRLLPLDPQLEEFFEIQFTPPGRMSAGNTCELTVLFKVPADFQQDLEGEIRCDAEYGGIFLIKIRGAIRKCKPFLITAMGTGFSPVSFNEKEAVEAKPLVKASYDMFAKKRVAERISENEVLLNFGVTLNGSSTRRKLILRNLGALETGIDVKSYSEGGAGGDRRKSIASKFSTQNSSIFFDVKTNGGILPSYGTASLTIEFSPQQDDLPAGFDTCAKDIMASFVINFDREGMHPIIFRCFARREDPPLNLSLNAIDFGICTDEEVYKLEAFLSNTSKAALKFDMYLDPDASCRGQVSHESISLTGAIIANISSIGQLEILPKTAFVQPNDPFRIRFKLKASLNEKHKLDQGQVHFKLPLVLKYISGLTNCEIKMFIKGSVTTNHISFSAPEVGIGKGAFGVDGLCAGSEPEQQQLQRQKSCTNSTSDVMAAASSAAASLSISSINYDSKIDFGKCSTQENIKYAFTITNHSVISQQIELVSSLPVLSIFPAEDEKLVMQIIDGKHTYNLEPQKTHKFLAKFEPAEPGYHEIVVTCTSNKKPKFNFVCYGSGIYPSVKFDSNEIKFADTSLGSFNSIKIPLIHEVIKINRPDHLPWLKNHQKTGGSKKLSDAFSSSSSPSGPYHQSATTEILSESDYAIEYEFLDPIVVDGLAPPPPMSLNAEGDQISKFTYAIDDPVPIHIW